MKKPTSEEIKAASYPAIQKRAREMDEADESCGLCGVAMSEHKKSGRRGLHEFAERIPGLNALAPKPDVPTEAARRIAHMAWPYSHTESVTEFRNHLALAIDEHTRKCIHEEWLITKRAQPWLLECSECKHLVQSEHMHPATGHPEADPICTVCVLRAENQKLREALSRALAHFENIHGAVPDWLHEALR